MTSLTWLYLPTAFVLGLAHALEPGHSKTIMASYLISIRGTTSDALLLGLTVTFTHTIVVFLLALGVVLLGQAFPLDTVQHWLEIISAGLVFLMGLWLLTSRIRALRSSKGHDSVHRHAQDHHQSLLRPSVHSHGHNHDHGHEHAHAHGHDHDHGHVHTLPTLRQRLSLRQLIAFGLSGGLVPCPAALAILILAGGLGKPVLGLVCVIVFSLGLAVALVGVGVAVCRGLGLFESKLSRWMKHLPVVSALIVALLGLWMLLRALFGHHHDAESLPARGS